MNSITFTDCKQRIIICLCFLITLLLSGCWSSTEIHEMAITNIIGIDVNDAGEYEVTAVLVRPSSLFSTVSNEKMFGDNQNKFLIETATGKTIFKAMNQLSNSISEKIYVGHMETVIFGEKAAREKMQPALDYFHRENGFRPNIILLIAEGNAADVIRTSPKFNPSLGLEILDFTKANRNVSSNLIKDISQFMKEYSRNTSDPVTGVLTSAEKLKIQAEGEKQHLDTNQQKQLKVASLDGTAVFKEGKLKGFLNEEETRGLLWILGDLQNDVIVLDCGNKTDENVSIIARNTETQFIPDTDKNTMTVKMNVEADIGEITCSNLKLDSTQLNKLNQQLEEQIVKEANTVLNKAQKQWQTDIFAFGEVIYRTDPKKWNEFAPKWRKGGLKNLKVNIKVHANISRYGLHKEPSKANESR
ncbi:Ger(x)C family spore germination protein [Bacillus sp. T3]|uniref:Ger(x)C family spore germination protein n=1 Tax=Bacillus sp. T3 TaxID=467262 RepID=UPI002982A5EC|nr:Ger(x)C family spore germination protein [Bacillus sp. T3]